MELKDWLIVIIPVILNGSLVFLLHKRFEKRQFGRDIKREHTRILLKNINNSIDLVAKMKILAFNGDFYTENGTKLSENAQLHYVSLNESNIGVFNYLSSNDNVFNFLQKDKKTLEEAANKVAQYDVGAINDVLAVLKTIKKKCENQKI
ncbi:MAG: hypothetical protein FWC90_07265 [Oscillospiraceae bacterium]|nr:hypothetical protein [Oscillospiraceae bacterium]